MPDLRIIIGVLIAAVLVYLLWRKLIAQSRAQVMNAAALFAEVLPLLDGVEQGPGESAGSWKVTGRYRGEVFQFQSVTDTLALRKLPSLWLMVTLPKAQPLAATIDVMMRAAGPSTFSNFDFLPHTLPLPAEFPDQAVIKSDTASARIPVEAMGPGLTVLKTQQGKELLLSPKGLRLVIQADEAERGRYVVLREARFPDARISAQTAATLMNALLQIDAELAKDAGP